MKTEAKNPPVKKRPQKLKGGSDCAMTLLKEKWRKLPYKERKEWRDKFMSRLKRAQLREQLREKYKLLLRQDSQITKFRYWADDEEERLKRGARIERRRKEMEAEGKTLAEIQETLLKEATEYSRVERDYNLGLKASSEITKVQNTALNRDKFEFAKDVATAKGGEKSKADDGTDMSDDEKLDAARLQLFGMKEVD